MPENKPSSTGSGESIRKEAVDSNVKNAQGGTTNSSDGTAKNPKQPFPGVVEEWSPEEMAHTFVIPSPGVQVSNLDGEAILLHLETGVYHALNQVGTVMWELFAPDRSLAQVLSAICARYDVTESHARKDLLKLVTGLCQQKLVQIEQKGQVPNLG